MNTDGARLGTPIGSVLDGSYRLVRLISKGGMGCVYEGEHLRLQRRVAVEVLSRHLSAYPQALNRFRREAMVTSDLGHPHIVQVFDFSTTPTGEPFLAMEFLDGEDMEHRLRRVAHFSAAGTLRIVKQVASALAATHAQGIVHRDLKPANIFMLEGQGETDFIKVLDFGISKVHAATTHLTKTSGVTGTPKYMSPEQALGRLEEIDERTDQWALACITWECFCGHGPFAGESVPSLLSQILHEAPPPFYPKHSPLPKQVEEVLCRALAKDKQERFPDVTAFVSALEEAIRGPQVAQIRGPG